MSNFLPTKMEPDGLGFSEYYDLVYEVFLEDFLENPPVFQGRKVVILKQFLDEETKYECFVHITSKGPTTRDRLFCYERTKRVPWIKPMIENSDDPSLLRWYDEHNPKGASWSIYHPNERYLVVIREINKIKSGRILITAYCVEGDSSHQKLLKYSKKYKK